MPKSAPKVAHNFTISSVITAACPRHGSDCDIRRDAQRVVVRILVLLFRTQALPRVLSTLAIRHFQHGTFFFQIPDALLAR